MTLKIYNTLSGKKETFIPIKKNKVGMYVCGVTVYDNCHLGHARVAVIFDMIFNYLKYLSYEVTYVRNFTDIDDKIINKANEEKITCNEIARRYINEFYNDMAPLGIGTPTFEPKATDHIPQMLNIIKLLLKKGIAYEASGDVLFSVRKFTTYGSLSKRNLNDMISGIRVAPGEHKKDPLDFVLWKKSKEGEPSWESPWGNGRPGWHIECSAMGQHYLGDTFDIHGGGKDLIFPHHENEIAQSEAAFGVTPVKYWVHNGFVNINKEKMSKSLKNFFTIKEIIKSYNPEVVRLFLLSTHYRSPLDFSDENLKENKEKLDRFYEMLKKVNTLLSKEASHTQCQPEENSKDISIKINNMVNDFEAAMNDDFNTALAIGKLFSITREVNKFIAEINDRDETRYTFILNKLKESIFQIGSVLGLFLKSPDLYFKNLSAVNAIEIEELIKRRNHARAKNDWKEADNIRNKLIKMNIFLQDTSQGTEWKVKEI